MSDIIFVSGCDLVEDDPRNFPYYTISESGVGEIPSVIEVDSYQYNQKNKDSCVGQAVGNMKSVQENEEKSTRFLWSLAKREQRYRGWGTSVPLALKMLQTYGVPTLSTVPDDTSLSRDDYMKICDNVNDDVYDEAALAKSLSYFYIYAKNQNLVSQALLTEKVPIVTTMMWYSEYNRTDANGFLPHPTPGHEVGGHAFVLIKKEKIGDRVKCTFKNSFGGDWGENGNFHVWEDEIVDVYNMGTFFVTVDMPKEQASIVNKYNGKLIKNEDSPMVYFVNKKEIVWIENEETFNFLSDVAWGGWKDIITIPEQITGTKKFNYTQYEKVV